MSNIEDQVCADIQTRASLGLAKYGTTVERTDLSQSEWVQHAYEECLDMAVYLKRLRGESCSLSKSDKQALLKAWDYYLCNMPEDLKQTHNYDSIKKKLQDDLKLV